MSDLSDEKNKVEASFTAVVSAETEHAAIIKATAEATAKSTTHALLTGFETAIGAGVAKAEGWANHHVAIVYLLGLGTGLAIRWVVG